MRVNKFFLSLGLAVCVFNGAANAAPLLLPNTVNSWQAVQTDVTPLDSTSGNLGQWTRRIYKRAAPEGIQGTLEVILMEGEGSGRLRVPDQAQDYRHERSKGLFDGDTEYKVLTVAGCPAILEHHKLLPLALAVSVSSDVTLTVESSITDENELVSFAESFITAIK